MTGKTMREIFERLQKELGGDSVPEFFDPTKEVADPKLKRVGDAYIVVAPEAITKVCNTLREQSDLLFNSLMCLGGVDEKERFVVAYHLFSFKHRHRANLKVRLPRENPKVKSVQGIWSGANWFERETFDLFGIEFENHPDLRRIMLPPDWVGHPLRKDYEFPTEYNGISCVRPKLK